MRLLTFKANVELGAEGKEGEYEPISRHKEDFWLEVDSSDSLLNLKSSALIHNFSLHDYLVSSLAAVDILLAE